MGSVLTGRMPWGWAGSSGGAAAEPDVLAAMAEFPAALVGPITWDPTETAMRPGRITRNGRNILGMVAMRGTRRADSSESAAMARWTTRKLVHQYPKLSTKPSPMVRPIHSTPRGFVLA